MTFWDDDRAVTVQVGVVLLFAILVVAMSLYQSTVVPGQNQGAEFEHQQTVQGQMTDLRNAILRTGTTGAGQPASVTLGTRYPQRTFFINPPPATGELRTTAAGSFTVENVTALSSETRDYWNSSRRTLSFSTRSLVYEPNYREYDDAPATVYENTVGYKRYESTDVPVTDQSLVQGRRITLVALGGSMAQSQSGTVSVDPRAVSPSATAAQTVSVRRNATGRPVTVRVPTDLSEAKWRDLLADQRVSEGGYVANVSVDGGVLTLTLDGARGGSAVTYDLRMANVDVGSSAADAAPAYVTDVRGTTRSVAPGASTTLVAEVRDEFNNPVSGVQVNVSGATGNVDETSRTTGDDGRVAFTYRAPAIATTETVTLAIDDGSAAAERVEYTVETTGSGTGAGNGRTVVYADKYDDWVNDVDANGKELGIPPKSPYGQVSNFANLRAPDGKAATLAKEDVNGDGELSVGIATYDIPNATSYKLQLQYQRSGNEAFDVAPVDSAGDTIDQTYTLSGNGKTTRSIALSSAEAEYVRRHGELFLLVEDTTTDTNGRLKIRYLRVNASS